jgi:hypothetical protein
MLPVQTMVDVLCSWTRPVMEKRHSGTESAHGDQIRVSSLSDKEKHPTYRPGVHCNLYKYVSSSQLVVSMKC